MSGSASFFDGRLRLEAGGFAYAGRTYAYADVAGVEFKQQSFLSRSSGDSELLHESVLRLVMKDGKRMVIRPETGLRKRVTTNDKVLHDAMAQAADWLNAYTFDVRMDGYMAELRTKGYVSWGKHQIKPNGELFYRHAYCMNMRDEQARCMLYPFHLACVTRPAVWWKRWLAKLVKSTEVIDLRRDRDCFLYLMRNKLGLSWPSETLRVYRGVPAEGIKEPPKAKDVPPKDGPQGMPREEPQGRREAPPPPPPQPKTMPTHVQHLAKLGLAPDVPWDQVKARYRQLVRVHHPDLLRGKGAKEAAIKQAEETLKGVNEAYAWLEDFYKLK